MVEGLEHLKDFLPAEGVKIVLTLFLAFLIGLEREEHKASSEHYSFGGVRSFPLIALIGYSIALLSGNQLLPEILGFLVVGGFLMLSYWHKLQSQNAPGMPGVTSELSGLVTYLLGALVYHNMFWIATTLAVASMLLLALKEGLEGLTKRIAPIEILTFTKFLLLTAVVLPILPNRPFGRFELNPFKTWLVVVAVSAVSYGSYLLLQATKGSGIVLSAILGGSYSSTVTTVALAKRSSREGQPHLFTGAAIIASAMMYLRITALVAMFNGALGRLLAVPFFLLAGLAAAAGWLWSRVPDGPHEALHRQYQHGNPLELRAALSFAGLFILILIATHEVISHFGKAGVYGLAGIMGVTDVDPFIMGMTQAAGSGTPLNTGAAAIVLAASSNNIMKGIYACLFADRRTGRSILAFLAALALIGLLPLLWLLR